MASHRFLYPHPSLVELQMESEPEIYFRDFDLDQDKDLEGTPARSGADEFKLRYTDSSTEGRDDLYDEFYQSAYDDEEENEDRFYGDSNDFEEGRYS